MPRTCREKLTASAYIWKFAEGALFFGWPNQLKPTAHARRSDVLRPLHLVSDDVIHELLAAYPEAEKERCPRGLLPPVLAFNWQTIASM